MFLSITGSPWWVKRCFCLEFALAHWDFYFLLGPVCPSVPRTCGNTGVTSLWECRTKPSQCFLLEAHCFCSGVNSHQHKLCRAVVLAGTAWDSYVPYHMVYTTCLWAWSHDKHTLSHTEGGRCSSMVSLRAVPPQLCGFDCQPPPQIGTVWIAFHCMELDRA